MKKIALFHPWIKSKGGAEKVVLEILKKSKNKIDVYTWVYDKKNTFEEFKKYKINVVAPKFFQKISRKNVMRGLFLLVSLFSKIPLKKYDLFLISTSGVGEFVTFRNRIKGKVGAYVHTPLRAANKKIVKWEIKDKKHVKRFSHLLAVKIYRILEKISWKKLDFVVFNSELSRQRAEESKILKGKKNKIIYPPIDHFANKEGKKENYFLYVSRINSPKRQLELLRAWEKFIKNHPGYKLILVGSGENKKYFTKVKEFSEKLEGVHLRSHLKKKELVKLYSNCLAGLFLGYQEDFGMVPLEIISYGKPLIAVDEGGYVNVIGDFHKIKEKHNSEEMVEEIEKGLKSFINSKKKIKTENKIKDKNFIKEIDEFLNEIK
jgi:glycosyltransferase involved in cell wall biosynthesis